VVVLIVRIPAVLGEDGGVPRFGLPYDDDDCGGVRRVSVCA
jgi:hypothetical protein